MVNFKELKDNKDLINLIKEKNNCLNGIRFAVSPNDIKRVLEVINYAKKKYNKITFNINLMYLSKWINEDKLIKKIFNLLSHKWNKTFVYIKLY